MAAHWYVESTKAGTCTVLPIVVAAGTQVKQGQVQDSGEEGNTWDEID